MRRMNCLAVISLKKKDEKKQKNISGEERTSCRWSCFHHGAEQKNKLDKSEPANDFGFLVFHFSEQTTEASLMSNEDKAVSLARKTSKEGADFSFYNLNKPSVFTESKPEVIFNSYSNKSGLAIFPKTDNKLTDDRNNESLKILTCTNPFLKNFRKSLATNIFTNSTREEKESTKELGKKDKLKTITKIGVEQFSILLNRKRNESNEVFGKRKHLW